MNRQSYVIDLREESSEDRLLKEIFGTPDEPVDPTNQNSNEEMNKNDKYSSLCQWTSADGKKYIPSSYTTKVLPPGVYEIDHNPNIGLYFSQIEVHLDGLIRFPDSNSDKVIEEIKSFWCKKSIFESHNILYKRGICLYGPPGSGKTCTIQFIIKEVINMDGIVIKFNNPNLFIRGIRSLKAIQPNTPIVVLMEDLDAIIERRDESSVLQILDGVDSVDNIVYLATTNYPEKLGKRIINRPSRFDKRFKIDFPNAQSRKIYLEHLITDEDKGRLNIDIDRWVDDTEEFSIAHLKELYVAVAILGDDYLDAIDTLQSMREDISSSGDNTIGF